MRGRARRTAPNKVQSQIAALKHQQRAVLGYVPTFTITDPPPYNEMPTIITRIRLHGTAGTDGTVLTLATYRPSSATKYKIHKISAWGAVFRTGTTDAAATGIRIAYAMPGSTGESDLLQASDYGTTSRRPAVSVCPPLDDWRTPNTIETLTVSSAVLGEVTQVTIDIVYEWAVPRPIQTFTI